MTNQPRFVNLGTMPVNVTTEQGSQRTVRPFRELQAMPWRTEQDCICVGNHYRNFPGLLEPFPGDETQPTPSGVQAQASSFRFRLSGEVIRASEAIVEAADAADAAAASTSDAEVAASEPVAQADTPVKSDESPEQDKLEYVAGMTAELAASLRDHGYATIAQLADCQSAAELRELAQVPGVKTVKFATKLAESAQDFLGWE